VSPDVPNEHLSKEQSCIGTKIAGPFTIRSRKVLPAIMSESCVRSAIQSVFFSERLAF
jgi:hypothetical protein